MVTIIPERPAMGIRTAIVRFYFNTIYNPVYDFSTARLSRYLRLQERCVSLLELQAGDRVLCVGLGTGNEIDHIFKVCPDVSITGVDYSARALRLAEEKAAGYLQPVRLEMMDVQELRFPDASFNKVLCIHVMDFLDDRGKATAEILRVLQKGGRYVITYPSDGEGITLGAGLYKEDFASSLADGRGVLRTLSDLLVRGLFSLLYLPLMARPHQHYYSLPELTALLHELSATDPAIDEEKTYHDYIVFGKK